MEEKEDKKIECQNCKQEIYFSGDVLTVERAVRGDQIIPLGGVKYFCSENCISDYYREFENTPGVNFFRAPY
ncbi:MYM-type Zinc finger with FCS sequence motif protein [Gimesia alba]|uniref:MYM-type Zinc finger with FCS sequence motif protein n=1 Tax=Gimesia alba TaxID=2527973 RepID=A0A517RF88_9PLAN|nr:hypothetical protein [Gimesia alba]QDT42536.1 MYM-type Zinc finger with FCS sequence motif protein [Gimesia alba]